MRSSALLTCSALFVAGGLAHYGYPHEEASLYARDAYPEAEPHPEAEPGAEADAYGDEFDLEDELHRREAGDDLDWAFNTRDLPQFDGHVSTRDLHDNEARLMRRQDWSGSQSQHLYPPNKELDSSRQTSYQSGRTSPGFEGGSEEQHKAMAAYDANKADPKATEPPGGKQPHPFSHYGERYKAYKGHVADFRQDMKSSEGRSRQFTNFKKLSKDMQDPEMRQKHFNRVKEEIMPERVQRQVNEYKQQARAQGQKFSEHIPTGMKEYASKFMGQPHEPRPIVARRSLDGLDGKDYALMKQLERRAAYEGRAAHLMASQEFEDA